MLPVSDAMLHMVVLSAGIVLSVSQISINK